jgi:hypothetical protein
MIKMGPVSFGAALIAAPKSLSGSLDVTFFELEHRTSAFAGWDTGRHVLQVGTLDVMFFELGHLNWILDQIMRPFENAVFVFGTEIDVE